MNKINKAKQELITFENNDFYLEYQPAKINFQTYEKLKKLVEEKVEGWNNYVVTPESYEADKKTRAELNRLKKLLDDERKRTVKVISNQVIEFDKNMKALATIPKDAADHIGKGIKDIDNQARKDKHQINLQKLGELAISYDLPLQSIDYQDNWDNKSISWPKIEKDARERFEIALQQRKNKQEIIKMIIEKAKSFTAPVVNPNPYIELLKIKDATEVINQIEKDHAYSVQLTAEHSLNDSKNSTYTILEDGTAVDEKTGELVSNLTSVGLKFTDKTSKIAELSKYIKQKQINYEVIEEERTSK